MADDVHLAAVEGRKKSIPSYQLGMLSTFDDPAVVDDEDLVGVADGREPVGDDEGGAAFHQAFQGTEER